MKKCPICCIEKRIDCFFNHKRSKNGKMSECKRCHGDISEKWAKRNPDKMRLYGRRANWKKNGFKNLDNTPFNEKNFLELLEKQKNKCYICGTNDSGKNDWSVDHEHLSKFVRAVLCHNCNLMLGHGLDNSFVLRRGADYIDEFVEKIKGVQK